MISISMAVTSTPLVAIADKASDDVVDWCHLLLNQQWSGEWFCSKSYAKKKLIPNFGLSVSVVSLRRDPSLKARNIIIMLCVQVEGI